MPVPWRNLGTHLLRTGDEPGHVPRSRPRSKSTRTTWSPSTCSACWIRLDKFETIVDGDLIFRMKKDEAPLMREYAVPLAHQALDTLAKRYEFTPKGPILIEFFSKHDDFAVRTLGLPGMIGALGAASVASSRLIRPKPNHLARSSGSRRSGTN